MPIRRRIFDCPVKRGSVEVDALVVICFDPRFWKEQILLLLSRFKHPVPLSVAGGAKDIAAGEEYPLEKIELSLTHHHPKAIYLAVHSNCGAYGSPEPSEKESLFLTEELFRARMVIQRLLAKLKAEAEIHLLICHFDGIDEVVED